MKTRPLEIDDCRILVAGNGYVVDYPDEKGRTKTMVFVDWQALTLWLFSNLVKPADAPVRAMH